MSAQQGPMKAVDCSCGTKRKAEEGTAAGEQCGCATRRKVEGPVAVADGVMAPRKVMTRVPQEKIDWILAQTKRPLRYSVDDYDTEDEELKETVRSMAQGREDLWQHICKLQVWIRGELAAKGFVEVDNDSIHLAAPPPPDNYPDSEDEEEEEEEAW